MHSFEFPPSGLSKVVWYVKSKKETDLSGVTLSWLAENAPLNLKTKAFSCMNFTTPAYTFRGPFSDNTKTHTISDMENCIEVTKTCREIFKTKYVEDVLGVLTDNDGNSFLIYKPFLYENQKTTGYTATIRGKRYNLRAYTERSVIQLQALVYKMKSDKTSKLTQKIKKKSTNLLYDLVCLYILNVLGIGTGDSVVINEDDYSIHIFCLEKIVPNLSVAADIESKNPYFYMQGVLSGPLKVALSFVFKGCYETVHANLNSKAYPVEYNPRRIVARELLGKNIMPTKRTGFPEKMQELYALINPEEDADRIPSFLSFSKPAIVETEASDEDAEGVIFIEKATPALKKKIERVRVPREIENIGGTDVSKDLSQFGTFSSNKEMEYFNGLTSYEIFTMENMLAALKVYIRKSKVVKSMQCASEIWIATTLSNSHHQLFKILMSSAVEDIADAAPSVVLTTLSQCNLWRGMPAKDIDFGRVLDVVAKLAKSKKSRVPLWISKLAESASVKFKKCVEILEWKYTKDNSNQSSFFKDHEDGHDVTMSSIEGLSVPGGVKIEHFKIACIYLYERNPLCFKWFWKFFAPNGTVIKSMLGPGNTSPSSCIFKIIALSGGDKEVSMEIFKNALKGTAGMRNYSLLLYVIFVHLDKKGYGKVLELDPIDDVKYLEGDYDLIVDKYALYDTALGREYKISDEEAFNVGYDEWREDVRDLATST